ncbi:DUF4374 domain-containing protein [Dyadobacter subterraneus]|uniref:DUF4374 domain-containing protein n=1 Tax=Dyadobacter subterraneus TaxID=2773304 RepID=A0ABR9WGP1_9BACT|nr:DUF4374 domain-containing protein [Dyadobacter subterraneus]MBE9463324.1 DUF4374 domain-containing protein [Dyadobacter subterraneus]
MNKIFSFSGKALLVAVVALSLNSCSSDDDKVDAGSEEGKYSAVLCVGSWPNTAYYIADVPSLTTGTISLQGNGAEMTGKVYAQDIVQKDGFYYHANFGSGRLGKYHVTNGALVTDKEVPFTYLNWTSYTWADDQTLVIFGIGQNAGIDEARYAIIKVADMSVTTGKLNLEALPTGFNTYNVGFAEYRAGKIYLGYGFGSSDFTNYPAMPVYQKFNVATISYPAMTIETSVSDTRSTAPGSSPIYAPSSFVDENNDIYFISDPVSNYDYKSPSAVYRIKSGSSTLDPTYYLDFSSKVTNEMGAAMWYIGNGKAIVRTRAAGESIDADHFYSVIDVKTGTFIKQLALPVDKGERMVQAVIVEDGKAYIAVNAVDKDYIWEYDPATDKLTHGAEFVGGIDYILRLEKTK